MEDGNEGGMVPGVIEGKGSTIRVGPVILFGFMRQGSSFDLVRRSRGDGRWYVSREFHERGDYRGARGDPVRWGPYKKSDRIGKSMSSVGRSHGST